MVREISNQLVTKPLVDIPHNIGLGFARIAVSEDYSAYRAGRRLMDENRNEGFARLFQDAAAATIMASAVVLEPVRITYGFAGGLACGMVFVSALLLANGEAAVRGIDPYQRNR